MNDNWSDQILDSFLDEIISGDVPPDLSDRILSQLAQRQKESNHSAIPLPEVPNDSDSDRSWWQQVVHLPPVEAAEPKRLSASPSALVTNSNSSLKRVDVAAATEKKQRHLLALSLGIVACVAAIVSLVSAFPELYRSSPTIAQQTPPKPPQREIGRAHV